MGRVQRGYAQIWSLVNRHRGEVGAFRKVFVEYRTKHHASSGETQFKPQTAQSITGVTSTGENGGMGWNNSMFWNEQINYVVGIVSLDLKFVHVNHRECNSHFERQNFRLQKIIFCPISNLKYKISPASNE